MCSNYSLSIFSQVSTTIHRPARGAGSAGYKLSNLHLRHLPGVHRRRFHIDGGRSRTFSSGTTQGPVVDVFTLMVSSPGPSAPAPLGGPPSTLSRQWWALPDLQLRHLPGACRRYFCVDGGCFWTFSSGTSRGLAVEQGAEKLDPPAGSQPLPRWVRGPLSAP
jgi:hypothetical protein